MSRLVAGLGRLERRDRIHLALATAAALFLAGVGAFGSGAAPFGLRLTYWIVTMAIGIGLLSLIVRAVEARGWLENHPWPKAAALSLLVALPQAVVVWAWTAWLFDDPWRLGKIAELYPSVLIVTAAFMVLGQLLGGDPARTHTADIPARFLSRIPPRLRHGELLAVEAEDHFLRVHTTVGADLIAFRFADALDELAGAAGRQVHRSWWVAEHAVERAVRGGGRATLFLECGIRVPVSRTFAPALRRDGWF